jgi:hypothetical protein
VEKDSENNKSLSLFIQEDITKAFAWRTANKQQKNFQDSQLWNLIQWHFRLKAVHYSEHCCRTDLFIVMLVSLEKY